MKIFRPTPVKLVSHDPIFPGSSVSPAVVKLTFALPDPTKSLHHLSFDLGLGDFVRFRFPGTQSRAYSPTSHPSDVVGTFTLVVRVYPGGQVSPKLAALKVGDVAEVKGPLPVPWLTKKRLMSSHVAMVAFGVGITEAVNLIRSELLGGARSVTLLWCLRMKDEVAIGCDMGDYSGDDRVEIVHAYSKEEGGARVDAEKINGVFGHLPVEDTSVLAVGTKRSERECYGWFRKMGYKRKLLKMGLRIGGRKSSPLRESGD